MLQMIHLSEAGHPGGSLSIVEILVLLYFEVMHIDPGNPKLLERDRFILSKGHTTAALYPVLALKGYFPLADLAGYGAINQHLQWHPDVRKTPGLDSSSGSLGQGLSIGAGMAMAAKLLKRSYRTFVLLGDGEMQEGQVWEALEFASRQGLSNLCAIVDFNGFQQSCHTGGQRGRDTLLAKLRAFGWRAMSVDGHDFIALQKAFEEAGRNEVPTCIVADTVKGKGISFMEGRSEWHVKVPSREELSQISLELGFAPEAVHA